MNFKSLMDSPTVKSFLSKMTNDSHVPVALLVFTVTTVYHFHTGKDLGANYVSGLYAFYGFLGAHFGCSQVWPDKPTDPVSGAAQ
jgi:hypothetical protein